MNLTEEVRKVRRGRRAKIESRKDTPDHVEDIVTAGLPGGYYKPLSIGDIEKIHATAVKILEVYGMADSTPEMQTLLTSKGAILGDDGRLRFPARMVEEALNLACREFTITGLDGKRSIVLGGKRVNFGGNSYTVKVQDLETLEYRTPTLLDLYDLVRLEDTLDNLHYVRIPVIAQDVGADIFDVNSAYAVAAATGKPFSLNISFEQYVDPVIELFDMIGGGKGAFAKKPFCLPIMVHVVPPLKFAYENCYTIEKLVRHTVPVIMYSAGMSGATSPASLAGMLAQTLAECFAGLIWVNAIKPGHPMLFGLSPLAADMRSGACVMGAAEQAVMEAACAQLALHYGLPGAMLSGTTDSKVPDIQAGWERSFGATTVALAGANHIGIAAGGHASNMGISAESLVIDNDQLGNVLRILKGIEVTEESLAFETIGETIKGEGHFLGHDDTMKLMKTEYYYPKFADRDSIEDWEMKGKPDIRDSAREHIKFVLKHHYPTYIDAETDDAIRKRFDIRLPRKAMRLSDRKPLTIS